MGDNMTSNEFLHGELSAQTALMMKQMDLTSKQLELLQREMQDVKLSLARMEGAWKAAVTIAAVVGAVVGFAMRVLFR